MKKLLSVLIALTILVLGATPAHTQSPTIYIDPRTICICACGNFTISIKIQHVVDLYCWECNGSVTFDPNLVECIGVEEGPFLNQGGSTFFVRVINNDEGRVIVACILLGCPQGVSGSGTLANLTFHCLGEGETVLHLENTVLLDSNGENIPHNTHDGYVTQIAPVGGVWGPMNKFEMSAPWLTLTSLLTVSVASIVYIKHKKKQQN